MVRELADDNIDVAVTCRVLNVSRSRPSTSRVSALTTNSSAVTSSPAVGSSSSLLPVDPLATGKAARRLIERTRA
jgi:hypothetical protein